jgi:hypothetical protein
MDSSGDAFSSASSHKNVTGENSKKSSMLFVLYYLWREA